MLMRSPLARERRASPGFIRPCAPILAQAAPCGPEWLHEIKHDGYRIVARRAGDRLRLWSRHGRDWTRALVKLTRHPSAFAVAAMIAAFTDTVPIDGKVPSTGETLSGSVTVYSFSAVTGIAVRTSSGA